MRARPWLITAGLFSATALLPVTAAADGSWTGPGWYVEMTESGFDATLVSGPYGDEAGCKAALPEDTADYSYYCEDEETDPTVEHPPRTEAEHKLAAAAG